MLINAVEDYFSRGFKVIPVHLELDKNNDKKAFFGILWKKEKECITENRVKNLIKNSISGYPSSKTGEPFKLKYNALGLLTGQASNLLVLDVDLGEVNGHDTLRREQIEIPPGTPSVKTQSGGQHFYFSFPEELKDVKTTRSFGAEYHIDIRGDGGLVFVPPSKINDENFYSWVVLLDGDAPPPPKKLIEFVLKHSTHAVKAVGEVPEINFSKKSTDELPITRYNHDTNACLECEGLLLSAGWQRVGNSDKWTRPGKAYGNTSAVFSQSGEFAGHFKNFSGEAGIPDKQYTMFDLMMELKFNGDEAKAREYVDELYGFKPKKNNKKYEDEYFHMLDVGEPVPKIDTPEDVFNIDTVVDAVFRDEKGLAELVKPYCDDLFLYDSNIGKNNGSWLTYQHGRWIIDDKNLMFLFISNQLEKVLSQAAIELKKSEKSDLCKLVNRYIVKCCKSSFTNGLMKWMKSLLPTNINDFDRDLDVINLKNGVYDLINHKLLPHSPKNRMMKQAPVIYNPKATCPKFTEFLEKAIITDDGQEDEDTIRTLQQWSGLCLLGRIVEQRVMFFYGGGANGKSTFLKVLEILFGHAADGGYFANSPIESFILTKSSNKDYSLANLVGARVIIGEEIENNAVMAEATIKKMASGFERVTVEQKYEKPVSVEIEGKIFLFGNHKLVIRSTDEGIWRKVLLIPWNYSFKDDRKPIDEVMSEFRRELPGILNWCISGLKDYQESNTLFVSKTIDTTIEEYRHEQDVLALFIEECCEFAEVYTCTYREIYREFNTWHDSSGVRSKVPGKTTFINSLVRKYEAIKKESLSGNKNILEGVRVRAVSPSESYYDKDPAFVFNERES